MSSHPFYQPPAPKSSVQQSPSQPFPNQDQETALQNQTWIGQQQELLHPNVDMIDTSTEIKIFADLPGFREEEIHVRCEGSNLRITAERHAETEESNEVVMLERPLKADRTITVPVAVDHDEATATYEDGVCRITLPKREAQEYTEISFS